MDDSVAREPADLGGGHAQQVREHGLGVFAQRRRAADRSAGDGREVQGFLTATKAGDLGVVYSYLAEDVIVHEPPALPYGGDHHGKQSVGWLLDAIQGLRDIVGREMQFLDAGDEHVIAVSESDWIGRASGTRVTVKIVEIYTFRDGKIADIDIYFKDPVAVVEAVRGAETVS